MRKVLLLLVVIVLVIFLSNCGESLTDKQLYEKAQKYENEENAELAIKFYEKLVSDYSQSKLAPEALFRIAVVAAGFQKNLEKSIEAYTRLVSKYPDSEFAPKSQFMIGYIYANEIKDYDEAKKAYNLFLEKYADVDSGMTASAKFELKNMGKDISNIDFLKDLAEKETSNKKEAKGN